MNSLRVDWLVRKTPRMALVVMTLFGLRTPRMVMQVCVASRMMPTPWASSSAMSRSAICSVMRSCTCGRRDSTSTTRASLLKPTILPLGM